MSNISGLEPNSVWTFFNEITKIPRPSKHEEQIISYLQQFATDHKLPFKKDKTGNLLIIKPASVGYENKQVIVLQSHVDMVCEKNSDSVHDFSKDPINSYIDNDWVKARGTTLGADDGIGMAMMLAILADSKLHLGPVECLFTIDEETGLTGAFGLEPGFITGNLLINLDSEDEGEIFIGCAGGKDTVASITVQNTKCIGDKKAYIIGITGLKGGHSGDDIHRGYGNAIKILGNILLEVNNEIQVELNRFEGGNLRNAIPREAFASVIIDSNSTEKFLYTLNRLFGKFKEEYKDTDPGIKMNIDSIANPEQCIDKKLKIDLLHVINGCPNGVIGWSKEIEGLVETSTNLASVKFTQNYKQIEIVTSQRSSSDKEKEIIVEKVAGVFKDRGFNVIHSDGYPGWEPKRDSIILKIAENAYEKLFGKDPLVKAIHAGLECGLFLEKNPKLDMISIGPTIKGVHSPDERLEIKTVKMTWDFLLETLKNI